MIARAVHAASLRQDRPLITVNCAAIPEALMESEFFGHEKGAARLVGVPPSTFQSRMKALGIKRPR